MINCKYLNKERALDRIRWQDCEDTQKKDTVRTGRGWVTGSLIIFWAIAIGCIIAWATK